jgi:hypothetical protein
MAVVEGLGDELRLTETHACLKCRRIEIACLVILEATDFFLVAIDIIIFWSELSSDWSNFSDGKDGSTLSLEVNLKEALCTYDEEVIFKPRYI